MAKNPCRGRADIRQGSEMLLIQETIEWEVKELDPQKKKVHIIGKHYSKKYQLH